MAVMVRSCPFETMKMGNADIKEYLSDVRARFGEKSPYLQNTMQELRTLMTSSTSSTTSAEIGDVTHKTQDVMASKVLQFRRQVFDMAKTVVELVQALQEEEAETAAECYERLDDIAAKVRKEYEAAKADLSRLALEYHQHFLGAKMECEDLEWWNMFHQQSAWACGSIALLLPGIAFALFKKKPPAKRESGQAMRVQWSLTSLALDWWSPSSPSETTTSPWVYLLLLSVPVACCMQVQRFHAARSAVKRQTQELNERAFALQKVFVRQNEAMWEGVNMCVADLEKSIEDLRMLDPKKRQWRLQDTIHMVGRHLFDMSMAIDEYIVWLSQRNFFPVNFAVRNRLGGARYDAIRNEFEDLGNVALWEGEGGAAG